MMMMSSSKQVISCRGQAAHGEVRYTRWDGAAPSAALSVSMGVAIREKLAPAGVAGGSVTSLEMYDEESIEDFERSLIAIGAELAKKWGVQP